MLKINFYPDSDRKDRHPITKKGIAEYKDIWEKDGGRIVKIIEDVSNLKFVESEINAIVFEGSMYPFSNPLSLKASIPEFRKTDILIHELLHRLFSGNNIKLNIKKDQKYDLELHKIIYLLLYDILIELENKDYAEDIADSYHRYSKSGDTKNAWEWVLSLSKEERRKKYKEATKKRVVDISQ